jgi:dTDP-4-dehydrorhamnose 3,5-epimerase-like enzyme
MSEKSIKSTKLEVHETKDVSDFHVNGELTVIWRDWDKILDFEPKMIYTSSVNPGEIKGPHLHLKRTSYFVCIKGKVIFIVKDEKGNYHEIESSEKNPILVRIPNNFPSAHVNLSKEISTILALADIAWRPNDNEMKNVTFDNYDLDKWKKVDR